MILSVNAKRNDLDKGLHQASRNRDDLHWVQEIAGSSPSVPTICPQLGLDDVARWACQTPLGSSLRAGGPGHSMDSDCSEPAIKQTPVNTPWLKSRPDSPSVPHLATRDKVAEGVHSACRTPSVADRLPSIQRY